MRLPKISTRARFGGAWLLLAACVGCFVVLFAAGWKSGVHRPPPRAHIRESQGCAQPACAKLGDRVSYVLTGRVTQVSSPQAGVVCVQVGAADHGGDYCVLNK